MAAIDFKQYKWFDSIWEKKTAYETEHEVLKAYSSFMSFLLNDKDAPFETRFRMMVEIDQEHNEIREKLTLLVVNEQRQTSGLLPIEKLFDWS